MPIRGIKHNVKFSYTYAAIQATIDLPDPKVRVRLCFSN